MFAGPELHSEHKCAGSFCLLQDDWAVRGNWVMVSRSNLFLRLTTTGPSDSVDLEEEEEEEYLNKNIFNLFKLEDNYCASVIRCRSVIAQS